MEPNPSAKLRRFTCAAGFSEKFRFHVGNLRINRRAQAALVAQFFEHSAFAAFFPLQCRVVAQKGLLNLPFLAGYGF